MDLIKLYKKMTDSINVAGVPIETFENLLRNNKVTAKPPFIFIIGSKTVVKCAAHYYINDEAKKKTAATVSNCPSAQKYLAVKGVAFRDCLSCHLHCIDSQKLRLPLSDCRDKMKD